MGGIGSGRLAGGDAKRAVEEFPKLDIRCMRSVIFLGGTRGAITWGREADIAAKACFETQDNELLLDMRRGDRTDTGSHRRLG